MQALEQGDALGAGKVRQHVEAEDAIEAADVAGTGQIHAVKSHQAAQARLHHQVPGAGRSELRSAGGDASRFVLVVFFFFSSAIFG